MRDARAHARARWGRTDINTYENIREQERQLDAARRLFENLSSDDPGSAGDVAELKWKSFLEIHMPRYTIVTKGVITSDQSSPSPQIDVIVITPDCPTNVIERREIPVQYVIAVFESKLNLRLQDIAKAVRTAHAIKAAYRRTRDPIAGIPPFYGVLGLGHAIANKSKLPFESVADAIERHDSEVGSIDMIDALAVPQAFCLSADPEIFCSDSESAPLRMDLHKIYKVLGDPESDGPADCALGLFLYKLFSYLEKRDSDFRSMREIYSLFERSHMSSVTIADRPLDQLLPRRCLERIAERSLHAGNTVFDFAL